jgi:predicted transcriptional regulator
MLTKEKILESIKAMPEDNFEDIDVLLERIVVLDKIERGIKDVEEGNVISNEEMKTVVDSWFKK